MEYKLEKVSCPSCGAVIDGNIEGKSSVFCTYCGTQIAINDGTQNINIHQRYTDDAEVLKEQNRAREDERNHKTRMRILIGCVIFLVVDLLVLFLLLIPKM